MTTLSKEDVVRMADKIYWPYGSPVTYDGLQAFAELARADLVDENERLKREVTGLDDVARSSLTNWNEAAATCVELRKQLTATRTALAAAEAREGKLREALIVVGRNCVDDFIAAGAIQFAEQLRDDSALREMIAGVYEECAESLDEFAYLSENLEARIDAIRALAEKEKVE